ncbi:hypothetical protein SAMN05444166_0243 [Singulisphaera sp. GP187]|uniref:hypothetical protein n=1 Tax=Singulisphaera sp. GP187 TaxID=1882752 RepID=UPI00092BF5B8|nr:hypothetical protein [Singulisphaera sp. GP187]SIN70204.1 hypothetical protein SAMN05444166_0243 [Singulisphaera sp. GP187]
MATATLTLESTNILKPSAEEWADAKAAFAPATIEEPGGEVLQTSAAEPVACCAPAEEIPCIACSAADVESPGVVIMTTPAIETPGRSTPIGQRTLPTINGAGLTQDEFFRVNGYGNRARSAYAAGMPDVDSIELDRVERKAREDGLRAVLRDRLAASTVTTAAVDQVEEPCCDHDEPAPCTACVDGTDEPAALPTGADEHMTADELADLAELNAMNPAGAVEAELDRFPAFAGWGDWTTGFYWTPTPTAEPEPRVTLAELIDVEAERLRAHGLDAYDLMAGALAELARVVRVVSAARPDQVWERVSVLDRDFTEHAAAWELSEPEMTPGGRIV